MSLEISNLEQAAAAMFRRANGRSLYEKDELGVFSGNEFDIQTPVGIGTRFSGVLTPPDNPNDGIAYNARWSLFNRYARIVGTTNSHDKVPIAAANVLLIEQGADTSGSCTVNIHIDKVSGNPEGYAEIEYKACRSDSAQDLLVGMVALFGISKSELTIFSGEKDLNLDQSHIDRMTDGLHSIDTILQVMDTRNS